MTKLNEDQILIDRNDNTTSHYEVVQKGTFYTVDDII